MGKCLLICTIFGLVQARFYQSKRVDNTLTYLQCINSTIKKKITHAKNILKRELDNLFSVTNLQKTGPYQLQATCKLLSEHYKCQFFIFGNSTTKHKINFMYPEQFDDSLIPIYLYQSFADLNHLIFIKNLKSYFKANYSICFECKKSFKTYNYKHLCKKRTSCFVCRRFFQSEKTYMDERLQPNFCNKLVTDETSFICPICNCTIYSRQCYKGHRVLCNGDGHFGWKCPNECNRFIYASKNRTSKSIKQTHLCSDGSVCKCCFKFKETNHICKLKEFKFPQFHSRLAFLTVVMTNEPLPTPLFSLSLIENCEETNARGSFKKILVADPELNFQINEDNFTYNYFPNTITNTEFKKLKENLKLTQDFLSIMKTLQNSSKGSFHQQLSLFLISSRNTCFICQDATGKVMVSPINTRSNLDLDWGKKLSILIKRSWVQIPANKIKSFHSP